MNIRVIAVILAFVALITYFGLRFDLFDKIKLEKVNESTQEKTEIKQFRIDASHPVLRIIIVTKNGDKFDLEVEIAKEEREKEIGLMFREKLEENKGMLFVYEADNSSKFWMKNCKIPLDIIFIDKDGVIIEIAKNAQPCYYDPCAFYGSTLPYRYVLEVNGGWSDKNEINLGDKMIYDNNDN